MDAHNAPCVTLCKERAGDILIQRCRGRGTGVPTIFKVMRENGSPDPRFETDENRTYFTAVLPIHPLAGVEAEQADAARTSDPERADVPDVLRDLPRRWQVLSLSVRPRSRSDLQVQLGFKSRARFQRGYLNPLIAAGLLAPTLPESPNAPTQKYQTTDRGRALLEARASGE